MCDSRQVSQALINILKNAAEAVESRNGSNAVLSPGWIGVTVRGNIDDVQRLVYVEVEDNGRGLPQENRDRLTEPYVTTRTKGTGLGLAIVKIMEDHNGDLSIEDRDGGGARVSLISRNRARRSKTEHRLSKPSSSRPMLPAARQWLAINKR